MATIARSSPRKKARGQILDAGKPSMSIEELDQAVAKILRETKKPMTLPQIERLIAAKDIAADTFDVQRSVRRLLEKGQASLTSGLAVTSAPQ